MAIAPWKKEDQLTEFMFQSSANYTSDQHQLHIGVFSSLSKVDYFTNASFAYATYEPFPRLLEVTLQDFDGTTRKLSDENGMSNYGALFYEKGKFDVAQYAIFANDYIDLSENVKIDGGLRLEHFRHQVSQDIPDHITLLSRSLPVVTILERTMDTCWGV